MKERAESVMGTNGYAIVLGRNYSTALGVIRSLGKAGYTVAVIYFSRRGEGKIVSSSRYLSVYREIRDYSDPTLLGALLELRDTWQEKPVLFPTDDQALQTIDRYRGELSQYFVLPCITGGSDEDRLERLTDKSVQAELARASGFHVAEDRTLDLTGGIDTLPEGISYPCFVKPLVSAGGRKSDIGKCDDEADLFSRLRDIRKAGGTAVLVQEYLPVEEEFVINGLCCDDRVLIPGVIRKSLVAKHRRGVTISGTLENKDMLDRAVLDAMDRFLKNLRYVGLFDLELIVAGGKIYFGEINLRAGGPNYIYTICGVNLPALAMEAMRERACPERVDIAANRSFVNDKVLWDDYLFGCISKREFRECRKSAECSITTADDDPRPELLFRIQMMLMWVYFKIYKKTQ